MRNSLAKSERYDRERSEIDEVIKYMPYLYFDANEPFFPEKTGYTILHKSAPSPSFKRNIDFYSDGIGKVIEYAIYWHFDIQHLYELEHVWVYIDRAGSIYDCEASFHGSYKKGLLPDKSNILDKTHVKLYSQPGKHAFLPEKEDFKKIPDLYTATNEDAGISGLIITDTGKGRYETSDEINEMVRKYLQGFRFTPSLEFHEYRMPENVFVPWSRLYEEIPRMIGEKLTEIRNTLNAGNDHA